MRGRLCLQVKNDYVDTYICMYQVGRHSAISVTAMVAVSRTAMSLKQRGERAGATGTRRLHLTDA